MLCYRNFQQDQNVSFTSPCSKLLNNCGKNNEVPIYEGKTPKTSSAALVKDPIENGFRSTTDF